MSLQHITPYPRPALVRLFPRVSWPGIKFLPRKKISRAYFYHNKSRLEFPIRKRYNVTFEAACDYTSLINQNKKKSVVHLFEFHVFTYTLINVNQHHHFNQNIFWPPTSILKISGSAPAAYIEKLPLNFKVLPQVSPFAHHLMIINI